MDIPKLKVEPKPENGRRFNRRLRTTGRIPAVCYGHNKEPLPLTINPEELMTILHGPKGMNALIELDGADNRHVFVQEMQRHPLERNLLHVDFLWVDTDKPVQRKVPVELLGRPIGIKLGGVVQIARRQIEVEALPALLPDKIRQDISELLIGDVVHVEDLALPEGVRALFDRNFTICAVLAPTVEEKPEEEEGEEGAEAAEGAEGGEAGAEKKEGE